MYLLAHAAALIECPRDVVFDYAANLENFAEWFPGVMHIAAADSLPFDAVGKQYRETVAVPLRGQRRVLLRVVEATAPSRIVTEGALPAILPRMEIELRDAGSGKCEIEWRMFSRITGGFRRWTLLPVARRLMTKRAQAALRRLRHRLEARG